MDWVNPFIVLSISVIKRGTKILKGGGRGRLHNTLCYSATTRVISTLRQAIIMLTQCRSMKDKVLDSVHRQPLMIGEPEQRSEPKAKGSIASLSPLMKCTHQANKKDDGQVASIFDFDLSTFCCPASACSPKLTS